MAPTFLDFEIDIGYGWLERNHPLPSARQDFESRCSSLAASLHPTPEDHTVRQAAMARLNAMLRKLFPRPSDVRLVPFGSFRSSCYTHDSDLDLALTGRVMADWEDEAAGRAGEDGTVELAGMSKDRCARVLRTLVSRLESADPPIVEGPIKCVLGDASYVPRVPVISFKEASTRISCDVSANVKFNEFKSRVMAALYRHQPLLAPLVQLVKSWARAQCINSAPQRTFNSWTLELLCVWALQCHPDGPLLPPLRELFEEEEQQGQPSQLQGPGARRPLQGAHVTAEDLDAKLWTAKERLRQMAEVEKRGRQIATPSVFELFWWFLHCGTIITEGWQLSGPSKPCVSVWQGGICSCAGRFDWSSRGAVEDPFDYTDNTARTLGKERPSSYAPYQDDEDDSPLPDIISAFAQSQILLEEAATVSGAERAMVLLFGPSAESQGAPAGDAIDGASAIDSGAMDCSSGDSGERTGTSGSGTPATLSPGASPEKHEQEGKKMDDGKTAEERRKEKQRSKKARRKERKREERKREELKAAEEGKAKKAQEATARMAGEKKATSTASRDLPDLDMFLMALLAAECGGFRDHDDDDDDDDSDEYDGYDDTEAWLDYMQYRSWR